ncbi:hypothetical protein B0J11DRAFT_606904 [Dendryphion nanum]|uniref:Uncharacterized protein n=1 Tax=Dendryphion nanum TaxID=256645 RepID=A0A9P9DR67_9PLEO|nr:hypothetical protein B0J11DRAFT_606904 [Dendryphion nanum]
MPYIFLTCSLHDLLLIFVPEKPSPNSYCGQLQSWPCSHDALLRSSTPLSSAQYGLAPNYNDRRFLLKFRTRIENILLDQSLKPLFDIVAKSYANEEKFKILNDDYNNSTIPKPSSESDTVFATFMFEDHTGGNDNGKEGGGIDVRLYPNPITKDKNEVPTYKVMPAQPSNVGDDQRWLETEGDPLEANKPGWWMVRPSIEIKWGNLVGFWLDLIDGGE